MDSDPIRVLLVEENPADTEQFREMLGEGDHGHYEVVHVRRLSEALNNLRARGFDAILLDLNLPDASGLDTLAKVRAVAEHVPVIVVSGLEGEENAIHALRRGAQTYVMKDEMDEPQLSRSIRYSIEHERAEQMITGVREYAVQIVDALHEPLVVLDSEHIIHSANQSFYRLFHLEPWQTEGRSIVDLATGEWKVPDFPVLLQQIQGPGSSPDGFELRHTFPGIGRRVMLLNARSVPAMSGMPEIFLLSFQDVTELTRAEETVRQANRKLNLLNSITRHDILNQLTVILGYLEILDGAVPSKNSPEYISRIEAASTAIKKQIQFTAEYQDIGATPPHWHRLQDVVWRAGTSLRRYGVTLKTDLNDIEIYADALLERVFSNLFENSLSHGITVTEISVSWSPAGDDLLLIVEDNGQGVPAELKEKIFSMGYGSSTGYGLFLIREILDMTGITIREAGIPGAGARFEIRVPKETYRMPQD
ncbi:response regulator [Methanosphaerula subterraneus]|uniref:sensor histidine kinase n=1 Tax=Methanosphaerula subterraneus TaxID=3350244 RepID=UPI003F838B06